MCGRFTLTTTVDELHKRFGVRVLQNVAPRWNIAPISVFPCFQAV